MTTIRQFSARLRRAGSVRLQRLRGQPILHFLHIGKTGGTTIKTALQNVRGGRIPVQLHGHYSTLADVPEGELCFFFVRDPLRRFVSGFYSRQRQGRPRYDIPWSPGEEEAFSRFASPNELALALSAPDASTRNAAIAAMRAIQHVRDPLDLWLGSIEELTRRKEAIFFVGSQEHLRDDCVELERLLDLRLELPGDDVTSHRRQPGSDDRLEADAQKNLREWYARDYAYLALLAEWFPRLPKYAPPGPASATPTSES